jgi:hypothetical protein
MQALLQKLFENRVGSIHQQGDVLFIDLRMVDWTNP